MALLLLRAAGAAASAALTTAAAAAATTVARALPHAPTTRAASTYVVPPPSIVGVPVVGQPGALFPVRRVFNVGRNYADHAKEMGATGEREPPFFFLKPTDNVVPVAAGATGEIPYPPLTSALHHEVELVVALREGGRNLCAADAARVVFGYAVGLDMTRRDLQAEMKRQGKPWCVGKAFEGASPIGPITPAAQAGAAATDAAIWLQVNGADRQRSRTSKLLAGVGEILEAASAAWELAPGDLVFTGTPAGVRAVVRGDVLVAGIDGLEQLRVRVV